MGKQARERNAARSRGRGAPAGRTGRLSAMMTGVFWAAQTPSGPSSREKLSSGEKAGCLPLQDFRMRRARCGSQRNRAQTGSGEVVGQHVHQVLQAPVHVDGGIGDLDDPGEDLEGVHGFGATFLFWLRIFSYIFTYSWADWPQEKSCGHAPDHEFFPDRLVPEHLHGPLDGFQKDVGSVFREFEPRALSGHGIEIVDGVVQPASGPDDGDRAVAAGCRSGSTRRVRSGKA